VTAPPSPLLGLPGWLGPAAVAVLVVQADLRPTLSSNP